MKPVTDGKQTIIGKVQVIGKERISALAGNFDTLLIEPELKNIRGVFQKSEGAKLHIWLSADRRRIPIKVESKVLIGSFIGELAKIEMPPTENYPDQISLQIP